MMPRDETYTNGSDDELGTSEKIALSAIFGAVLTGVSAIPGVAGVFVSAPSKNKEIIHAINEGC